MLCMNYRKVFTLTWKIILSLIVAVCISRIVYYDISLLMAENISISTLVGVESSRVELGTLIIASIIIFVFICITLIDKNHRIEKGLIILSLLFGVVESVSLMFYYYDSFTFALRSKKVDIFCILSTISYGLIFYMVSYRGIQFFTKLKPRLKTGWWDRNIGVLSFIAILAGWLPWLIAFYPGSMWFDMCYQLEQYYGFQGFDLHPVFTTFVMGTCLDIGKAVFHSDNVGVFIYIMLQSLVCLFVYSRVTVWINRHRLPMAIQIGTICYYSLLPIFGSVAQYGVKDVMAYGLFTAFVLQIVNDYEWLKKGHAVIGIKRIIATFLISLLCCLYRKEMIIVCSVVFILCLIMGMVRREKNKIVFYGILLVLVVSSYKGFDEIVVNNILADRLGIYDRSSEVLSIPLQQVARYVYYNSDKLTEDEKRVLDECFVYGTDGLPSHYNPYLSDPVKYNFRNGVNGFWKTYFGIFCKDPITYFEATWANSFGYYSIIPPLPSSVHGAPTNGTPGDRYFFYINRDMDADNNIVDISYWAGTTAARKKLVDYADSWRDIPVLCLFYCLGFYTWVFVGIVYMDIKNNRSRESLILYVPTVLIILVCIASPVNDALRYYVGVIASLPCMLSLALLDKRTLTQEVQ